MKHYIDQGYQLHERPADVPVNWRVGVYGLVERDGKLLMVDQIVAAGPTLSLPGGGLDLVPEETILEGSVREVYEETGYRFSPDPESLAFLDEAFFRSPSGKYWHIVAFLVQGTVEDEPDPGWHADPDEIVAVNWVNPTTLTSNDLRTLHWNALVTLGYAR